MLLASHPRLNIPQPPLTPRVPDLFDFNLDGFRRWRTSCFRLDILAEVTPKILSNGIVLELPRLFHSNKVFADELHDEMVCIHRPVCNDQNLHTLCDSL